MHRTTGPDGSVGTASLTLELVIDPRRSPHPELKMALVAASIGRLHRCRTRIYDFLSQVRLEHARAAIYVLTEPRSD